MSSITQTEPAIRPLERSRTRTFPPVNATAEFILSSIPLAENTRYVAEYDCFVSIEEATRHDETIIGLWEEAEAEKERLLHAMELLQQKMHPKQSTAAGAAEERRSFTWRHVITEIQTASDSYKRTVFARMCEESDVFEHWLSLLPTGDYTSTISGAFVMGVQAARSVSSIQRSIYEALATIPYTLSHASAYVEIYKAHSSDALVQKTAGLCKDILCVLRLTVEFFAKSSWRRGAAALVKGGAYQQELQDAITGMRTQALLLREEAHLCLQKRIAEMDKKNDIRASQEKFRHQLAKDELLLAIDSSTEITAQKVCTYLMRQLQSNPDFSVRTGGLITMSGSGFQFTESSDPQHLLASQVDTGVTLKALLKALEVDVESHQDDIEYCLTLGFTQTEAFRHRATWVLRTQELESFIAGKKESQFLITNGNHDAAQFVSPLSFVCAKIADLSSASDQVYSLVYFCSRHTDEWREPRANAVGLLADLTAQLLTRVKKRKHMEFQLDLSSLSDDICAAVQSENLDAIFDVFRTVVKQLPKGKVIFCIIDGISAYENSDRRRDTILLMQKLIRLVKQSKNVAFKCMVTFPGRGSFTQKWGCGSAGRRIATLEVDEDLV